MNATRPSFESIEGDAWVAAEYDLSIFALGFETRATHFLDRVKSRSKRGVALGFAHARELAYDTNRDKYLKAQVQIIDALSDIQFEEAVADLLGSVSEESRTSIFVDISCFSRFRLAAIVHQLFSLASRRSEALTVDFAYSLAKFERPKHGRQSNTVVGPAHHAFAGWSQGGYSSTAAVLGLEYEQDQALGVVEYLQAGEIWAFAPNSPEVEYRPEVEAANELLLTEISPRHVLEYDVCAPTSIIATLESVARGLSEEHSVVLVPFGPKVFVLCSLLVAAINPAVAVWRVSQGNALRAQDRLPSEVEVGLRVTFA